MPVFLKLELQAVISYPVWVLETDLGFLIKACTLETAEPSLQPLLFKFLIDLSLDFLQVFFCITSKLIIFSSLY